jgi:VanZ family protein
MTKKLIYFMVYWFPILIYTLLIFIQSAYPSPQRIPEFLYRDKVLHFAAFAVLGALFFRAFMTLRIKDRIYLVIILSILLSSLYGISDEIHQHYIPYRQSDPADAIADILGSVCGVLVYYLLDIKIRTRLKKDVNLLI